MSVAPLAQDILHSLPKEALPAHGLKVDSTTVPVMALLEQTTVNQMLPQREVITVNEDTPLKEAMTLLASKRILSMPVVHKTTHDVLGFVDVMDILSYMIRTVSEGKTMTEAQWSSWARDIAALQARGQSFSQTPVQDIIAMSRVDPYFPVYGQGTVLQAIEHFAAGVHRAAVFSNLRLANIISQSDVLAFLTKNLTGPSLGMLAGKTLEELRVGTPSVISMSTTAQAIHAVFLMFFNKVSAVAITDEQGKLVANLSASELRGVGPDHLDWLLLPINDFLKKISETVEKKLSFPLTCHTDTKIEDAINMMGTYRVHRIWIVDFSGVPIGVVSLTDIMRLFLPNDPLPEPAGKPPGRKRSWVMEQ